MEKESSELKQGSILVVEDLKTGQPAEVVIQNPAADTRAGKRALVSVLGENHRPLILKPEVLQQGGIVGRLRFPGFVSVDHSEEKAA